MLISRIVLALTVTVLGWSVGSALAQTSPARAALSRADSAFLKQAAENGHMEIEGSRIALEKSTTPKVREFAQTMITDHQQVGAELKTLATGKGVEVPNEPSLVQRTRVKLLSTNEGDELSRRYVEMLGVEAHQETIELFEKSAANATDPDVKAFAMKMLPALQRHLTHARELQTSLAGNRQGSGTAGSTSKAGTTDRASAPSAK